MTLVVKCVICQNAIPNPTCYSETCKGLVCQDKYRRFLIWDKREKAKKKRKLQKAKDYKVVKIKKTKRKTKK